MRPFLVLLLMIISFVATGQQPAAGQKEDTLYCSALETAAVPDAGWLSFLHTLSTQDSTWMTGLPPGCYSITVLIVIGKSGCIDEVRPLADSIGYNPGNKIAAIIASYPGRWQPATRNGREVKAFRRQCITLIINGQEQGCDTLPLVARTNITISK